MEIITAVLVLGIIGAVLGALIAVAAKFLHVEEDPRLGEVTSMLPGANCGACGYPGCSTSMSEETWLANCEYGDFIPLENGDDVTDSVTENA